MKDLVRGLSSELSLGDLVRHGADRAEAVAKAAAGAAGKTAAQVARAAKAARAASIRKSAGRAGVSATTARRWAAGTQKPRAGTASKARARESRAQGGAAQVRADRMRQVKSYGMGTVTVEVYGATEERDMGHVTPDPGEVEKAAAAMEAGDEDEAARLLGDALLEAYGDGLAGFMTIVDIPNPQLYF